MSVEDSSREVQSDRHTNEEGRLSQAELIEWSRRQRAFCAEDESNKARTEAIMVCGIMFHYAHNYVRGQAEDRVEGGGRRRSRLQYR